MKLRALAACLAVLTAFSLVHWKLGFRAVAREKTGTLGVEELMQNVDRYPGEVTVEGVVSGTSAAQRRLVLIDAREYAACGVTTCARYELPVSWSGPMPAPKDAVRITGRVQERGGRLIFVARLVERAAGGGTHP